MNSCPLDSSNYPNVVKRILCLAVCFLSRLYVVLVRFWYVVPSMVLNYTWFTQLESSSPFFLSPEIVFGEENRKPLIQYDSELPRNSIRGNVKSNESGKMEERVDLLLRRASTCV